MIDGDLPDILSKLRRVTSQETHPPQSDESDVPDTEVILVPAPAPVFVDSTGRRRRLLRRASYGFGAFCVVYGGLVSVSLAGGPVSPQAFLPFPDLADGPAATSPSTRTRTAPTAASALGASATPSATPDRILAAPPDRPRSPGSAASPRGGGPVLEGTRTPSASPSPSPSASVSPSQPGSPPPTSAPPTSPAPGGGGGGTGGGRGGGAGTGLDEDRDGPDDGGTAPCPVTPPKVTLTVIGLVDGNKTDTKTQKQADKKADKKADKQADKQARKQAKAERKAGAQSDKDGA